MKKVPRARPSARPSPRITFDPSEPLLGLPDVAKRLGVSAHTVRKLTYKKGLRWTKIGREIRFKREWVEEFIETGGR